MPRPPFPKQGEREEMEDWIDDQAAEDPLFRARLIADPRAVLAEAVGKPMPADLNVVVVEDTPDTLHLVLRFAGSHSKRPLPDGARPHHVLARRVHEGMEEGGLRQKLKGGARKELERTLGVKLGPKVEVQLLEETRDTMYVVLRNPEHLSRWEHGHGKKKEPEPAEGGTPEPPQG